MFSKVSLTGMVTTIYDADPQTKTQFITTKVLQTVMVEGAPVQQYAEVILKLTEGYEKYTGHIELGDLVSVEGRFIVSENGGPFFSDNDGLPHFVVAPWSTSVLGHGGQQTGMDKFTALIVGNLGKDPEMRFTPNGLAVTNISIAASRKYTGPKEAKMTETTWFRISFWDKLAETANTYLKKGSRILLEGHVKYDPKTHGPATYEKTDKSLGSSFEITGRTMQMISSGGGGGTHEPMGNLPDEEPIQEEPENEQPATPSAVSKSIPF